LVAAYFVKSGKTPEEAEALVKTKRPPVHREEIQRQALQNFSKK
jgi:protein-tyrosine phosphatase